MSEANKGVVLSYVHAFNRGDRDAVCAQFTPDALVWGVLGWGRIDKVRPIWRELIECLEMQLHVDAMVHRPAARLAAGLMKR